MEDWIDGMFEGWIVRRWEGEKAGRSGGWKVGRISRNLCLLRYFPYSKDLAFLLFPDTFGKCWKAG